jgi:hypothetical protein
MLSSPPLLFIISFLSMVLFINPTLQYHLQRYPPLGLFGITNLFYTDIDLAAGNTHAMLKLKFTLTIAWIHFDTFFSIPMLTSVKGRGDRGRIKEVGYS